MNILLLNSISVFILQSLSLNLLEMTKHYKPHNKIKQIPQSSLMTLGSSNIRLRAVASIVVCNEILFQHNASFIHFTQMIRFARVSTGMYGEAHPSEALQLFVLNLYLHWLISWLAPCMGIILSQFLVLAG